MQTKVSMVIPCYNKERWIGDMLQSVHDQYWDNIEVIIVNDGSTDGTRDVITQWEPKLRARGYEVIIIDQENQGPGAALKNGSFRITGEYVCFPDCDDVLSSKYVLRMASVLDNNSRIQWVRCNMPKTIVNKSLKGEFYLLLLLLSRTFWSVCFSLVRNAYLKCAKVFGEKFILSKLSQEMPINIPLALGGSFPYFLNEELYYYRTVPDSIMTCARSEKETYVRHWHKYLELTLDVLREYEALNDKTGLMARIGIEKVLGAECGKEPLELQKLMRQYLIGFGYSAERVLKKFEDELFEWIFDTILFKRKCEISAEFNNSLESKKSVVVCACMGANGREVLPWMRFLGYKNLRCWDKGAKMDSEICGYQISLPDYGSLSENDIVLILSILPDVIVDIRSKCGKALVFEVDEVAQYIDNKIFEIGELI